MMPNILIGKFLKRFKSKIPNIEHISANIIDTPANVKATGYPTNNELQTKIINKRGIISINLLIV